MPSATQTNLFSEESFEKGPSGQSSPSSSRPFTPEGKLRAEAETLAVLPSSVGFEPSEVRELNRRITRTELLPQREDLAKKRAALFEKRLDGTLTKSEQAVLRYVEWQLDRIEDAVIGEQLDVLSAIADTNQVFSERVGAWLEEIKDKMMLSRPKQKKRLKR